jgi:hypothetical protein
MHTSHNQPLFSREWERKKKLMTIVSRLFLIAELALISWQATTRNGAGLSFQNGDKVLHFIAFASLAALMDFSFPKSWFGMRKIMSLLLYGLLIEYVQSFMPWRSVSLLDWVADMFGIAIYLIFIPLLRHLPLLRLRWIQ